MKIAFWFTKKDARRFYRDEVTKMTNWTNLRKLKNPKKPKLKSEMKRIVSENQTNHKLSDQNRNRLTSYCSKPVVFVLMQRNHKMANNKNNAQNSDFTNNLSKPPQC